MTVASALVLLAACGGSVNPAPEQLAHDVGTPTASATTASLSPAGGSLTSADGQLTLTIPPGALSGPVDLTVQPLDNTANGGLLSGWRLGPDGTTFAKPITLTLKVPDGTIGTIPAGALGFASQRADGHWKWETDAAYDATAHTASATITHFSDWSLVGGFNVRPPYKKVKTGEKALFAVAFCYSPNTGDDDLTALGYECDIDASDLDTAPLLPTPNVERWSVDGTEGGSAAKGTVTWQQAKATYTAPAERPSPDTVSLSADVKWKSKGKLVATAVVAIDPPLRVYKGNVMHTINDSTTSVTMSGDVTWTEVETSVDSFVPSGTVTASINVDGCTPYTGSVHVGGGELDLNSPADGQYGFTVTFDPVDLNCGAAVVPFTATELASPPCDTGGTPPSIMSGQVLSGSGTCYGGHLSWSFARQ